jgi:hypothetical protein
VAQPACDRCGVGPLDGSALEPLDGTAPRREFCPACASVVRALAANLDKNGASVEEILRNISLRFSRPPLDR